MRFEAMAGAALSIACVLGAAGGASAAVNEIDIGINPTYQQTDGTTVVSTGGFFAARAFLDSASDFDGGTVVFPGGGSPITLTPASGATLAFGDSAATLAALNAAYPFGTYSFTVNNSVTSATQSASLNYTVAADSLSVPTLTAASFNQLQGLHAGSGFTFNFNAFDQNPNANVAFIFLDVTDTDGNDLFSQALDPSTTSIFMPGGTLAAGKAYNFDLLFDSRIEGKDGDVPTSIFFDTHTMGAFTTAVPEPSTWAMMMLGFAGLGAILRRRPSRVLAA